MDNPNPRKRSAEEEYVYTPRKRYSYLAGGHHGTRPHGPMLNGSISHDLASHRAVPPGAVPGRAAPYGAVPYGAVPHGAIPPGAASYGYVPPGSLPLGQLRHYPAQKHKNHAYSRIGSNFHTLPYPLGCMPYGSWYALHNGEKFHSQFQCPACLRARKPTAHLRKLFLVAERLSRADGYFSAGDRNLNEELNWEVNYQLGILDPFVEDADQVPGGKNSRSNPWYPYKNGFEMQRALDLIATADNLTEASWSLWTSAHMYLGLMRAPKSDSTTRVSSKQPAAKQHFQQTLEHMSRAPAVQEVEEVDLTGDRENWNRHGFMTPPPSAKETSQFQTPGRPVKANSYASPHQQTSSVATHDVPSHQQVQSTPSPSPQITSYRTLQDYYSLLDQIERTSYVGARFLEAYAERLRDDLCADCWSRHNINLDCF
jgi:hypothetical protein